MRSLAHKFLKKVWAVYYIDSFGGGSTIACGTLGTRFGKLLLQVAQNRSHNRELTRAAWCACGMSLINIALNPPFGSHQRIRIRIPCQRSYRPGPLPRSETDRGEGSVGVGHKSYLWRLSALA